MTQLQKFSLRLAIYSAVIGYLVADLFIFSGPLSRRIEQANPFSAENLAVAKANGLVARVFNHQITRGQLDRAIQERLWLAGASEPESPEERKLLRYAALNDLIDHELLRVKAMANANDVVVEPQEVNAHMQRFKARFPSQAAFLTAMKSQGIPNEATLRERMTAHLQQERYVALKIEPITEVTEEETQQWFADHQDQLAQPEQVKARHIFLRAMSHSDTEANQKLQRALDALQSRTTDFATLAKEISQDPATQLTGGDLGWFSRKRLPAGFPTARLFEMPLHQPAIARSEIGWHLIEVTAHNGPQPSNYEESKAEIATALKAIKRREAIRRYRQALRQFEAEKITIFHDMMVD